MVRSVWSVFLSDSVRIRVCGQMTSRINVIRSSFRRDLQGSHGVVRVFLVRDSRFTAANGSRLTAWRVGSSLCCFQSSAKDFVSVQRKCSARACIPDDRFSKSILGQNYRCLCSHGGYKPPSSRVGERLQDLFSEVVCGKEVVLRKVFLPRGEWRSWIRHDRKSKVGTRQSEKEEDER